MSEAELLDDLSGFEFEDLMEDVFRKLGFENVRQAKRRADEGRDVVMEEVVDGQRRAVVVECKHTDTVGRPVVQKTHSAVATFDYDGPRRGMVVTTGRFTAPAREYAQDLRDAGDSHPIELIDGTDLREIAEEVGLDLYNGRIEVVCEESLRPFDPTAGVAAPVRAAFADIENLDPRSVPDPDSAVRFQPVVLIAAAVDATFETSVGVIHRVDTRDTVAIHADRDRPRVMNDAVRRLVERHRSRTVDLDQAADEDLFEDVKVRRFGQTETEYKEWVVDRLRDRHTATVSYTGDNNVTYTKTCEPNQSDVSVQSIDPVYLPELRHRVSLQQYSYHYQHYAAGPSRVTIDDGIRQCVHCNAAGTDTTYTYCRNCGAIACPDHVETERLEGTPVCTGCAVTERFALKTKYFYDEENLERFREEYDQLPVYRKAWENPLLAVAGSVILVLVLVAVLAVLLGI